MAGFWHGAAPPDRGKVLDRTVKWQRRTRVAGIVAYGTYLPYWRLERRAIEAVLGSPAGRGTRAVASFDEDTTSMAVEAGRIALAARPEGVTPSTVLFATASPAYQDKTNATAIHAALALPESVRAYDMVGSVRSGWGAMHLAHLSGQPTLVALSDIRGGLPGGADERDGGDAACAFLVAAEGPVLTETLGAASSSREFTDRWRVPGEQHSHVWEERFGEAAYLPAAETAVTDAFKRAGVTAEAVDHLIVTGVHPRAAKRLAAWIGVRPQASVDDLSSVTGHTGAAHAGLLLAGVLDRAEPGQVIALVHLADGADVAIMRTTETLAGYRDRRRITLRQQIEAGRTDLPYASFLTWRGEMRREPPRRPDPEAPAAPPAFRDERWKFGFFASRCELCGTRHLPPARVCVKCKAVDQMATERLADVKGTVATFTVDRLAFSLSPPVVAAVIDFDGGGRLRCELTDVDPAAVKIGTRVEMTFRRLFTAKNGVHNYFWKARPIKEAD
jgi:hydroxymethylglutaryl-CoA synthase